jgi:hypothetical protein
MLRIIGISEEATNQQQVKENHNQMASTSNLKKPCSIHGKLKLEKKLNVSFGQFLDVDGKFARSDNHLSSQISGMCRRPL